MSYQLAMFIVLTGIFTLNGMNNSVKRNNSYTSLKESLDRSCSALIKSMVAYNELSGTPFCVHIGQLTKATELVDECLMLSAQTKEASPYAPNYDPWLLSIKSEAQEALERTKASNGKDRS